MAFFLSDNGQVLYEGPSNCDPSMYHEITVEEANDWRESFKNTAPSPAPTPAEPVYDNATLTAAMLALTQDL